MPAPIWPETGPEHVYCGCRPVPTPKRQRKHRLRPDPYLWGVDPAVSGADQTGGVFAELPVQEVHEGQVYDVLEQDDGSEGLVPAGYGVAPGTVRQVRVEFKTVFRDADRPRPTDREGETFVDAAFRGPYPWDMPTHEYTPEYKANFRAAYSQAGFTDRTFEEIARRIREHLAANFGVPPEVLHETDRPRQSNQRGGFPCLPGGPDPTPEGGEG